MIPVNKIALLRKWILSLRCNTSLRKRLCTKIERKVQMNRLEIVIPLKAAISSTPRTLRAVECFYPTKTSKVIHTMRGRSVRQGSLPFARAWWNYLSNRCWCWTHRTNSLSSQSINQVQIAPKSIDPLNALPPTSPRRRKTHPYLCHLKIA